MTAAVRGARCPLCRGAGQTAFEVAGHQYLRCAACASLWLYPVPTEAELDAYYASGSFYAEASAKGEIQRRRARQRLNRLAKRTTRRRLLDFGCADGVFLEVAGGEGWNVMGADSSNALVRAARDKGLEVVQTRDVEALPLGAYDVVTAWEVLEHVQDPAALVAGLARRVAPGGVLAVSTPNGGGLVARLLGRRYPFALVPEHLVLLSLAALVRAAGEAGLNVEEVRTFSGLDLGSARRGLSRRLGSAGQLLAPPLAAAAALLDAAGMGTELELYAARDP